LRVFSRPDMALPWSSEPTARTGIRQTTQLLECDELSEAISKQGVSQVTEQSNRPLTTPTFSPAT